ncbi:hypothetical protein Q7P37_000373 [Cladosporium fusiforme]
MLEASPFISRSSESHISVSDDRSVDRAGTLGRGLCGYTYMLIGYEPRRNQLHARSQETWVLLLSLASEGAHSVTEHLFHVRAVKPRILAGRASLWMEPLRTRVQLIGPSSFQAWLDHSINRS